MSIISPQEKYSKLALNKEATFDWIEAEKNYQSAISTLLEKGAFLEAGETQERAAYCRYRAAYQSETREEFKALLEATSGAYGRAARARRA